MSKHIPDFKTDILLIGGGIMSATLGVLLKMTRPNDSIIISERLSSCAMESSFSLNNAGTGHAGYCELNYTPQDINGNIDVSKAVKVNKAFNISLEFWKYLTDKNILTSDFYHHVPHYTFVHGKENVEYLESRYRAMESTETFSGSLQFSKDFNEISNWLPLVMEGRDNLIPVAATKADKGADIDFGKLTKQLLSYLSKNNSVIKNNEEVEHIYREDDKWRVIQKNLLTGVHTCIETKFLFIGAGGASITLLEKSGIPEGKGYGGFPVSGQWLICKNQEVVKHHQAKVYGKPSIGSPPMSVPHLDTRIIDGEQCLLFGPFAGMSTKFLKYGSNSDFFKSIRLNNIGIMADAGIRNIPLTKYLISELLKGAKARHETLQEYFPNANQDDWELAIAGQRVQIMKSVDGKGVIEFGTEIVTSKDGSLGCLLGASPGASTSVKIMLDLMSRCFNIKDNDILKTMTPSYN